MDNHPKPIMLIGSMKCGTTSLYHLLIKHPEICGGKIKKEPQYFAKNMGDKALKSMRYVDLFEVEENVHKFILDGSTSYTKHPVEKGVPNRIKSYGLDPYFIYIIRNPFERIRSHYNFMQKNIDWNIDFDSAHLINTSKYYMQLSNYEKVFPRENILVVEFDDLKKDPESLCNRVFKFIGASEFQISADAREIRNKTKGINQKRMKVKSRLSVVGKYFPSSIRKITKSALQLIYPDSQKFMSEEQEAEIKKQLKDDMKLLQSEYNIDISKWGF